jgi:hypothetical protein
VAHEHGIQIDPKKVESIKKLEEPKCKRDDQKLLGKINYLRQFITNFCPWYGWSMKRDLYGERSEGSL